MTLSTAYGGNLLSSGEVPMEGTWDFGAQELNNVSILAVGTATPDTSYAMTIDAATQGRGFKVTNIPSGNWGVVFTGGAMTAGSGLKMINADDMRLSLSSSTTNTVSIASGAARSFYNSAFAFVFGSTTDVDGYVQIEQKDGAAEPVMRISQLDTSEEFIRWVGESAADNSMPLVDAADLTTPGAIVGWRKVFIEDVASSGAITDAIYYEPFYATPTA